MTRKLLQEQAKIRMMKKKGSEKTESYWDNLWGDRKDYTKTGREKNVNELADACYPCSLT